MSALVEELRGYGLAMGSRRHNTQYGWTSDPEKAALARQAGASVFIYIGSRKFRDPVDGFEISVPLNVFPLEQADA